MESEVNGATSSGRRLMITEMVLENFKSYAGRQPVGPFHKCFSSVVGPNGSGKSNVIDAMLFVFGKRAKQLRLNKVSELIHNSSKHRNLDTAKVAVYFQEIVDTGEESFDVVPGSDFVVSRTAHRNNTSNYFIDERRSNFGEVTDLLKSKGIDLNNNRFLILQGEVEQISMMKPKALTPHETGLLEYLEDLIGTDKYVEQIEAGSKQLEEMNEKRQSMVQRLKIVERERDGLEGARIAAEAYIEKERECMETRCLAYYYVKSRIAAEIGKALVQMHIKEGERHIGTITNSTNELKAKLEYEQNKKQQFSADLEEAKQRYEAEREVQIGIQSELDKTGESFKEFERKDIKLREDIKHLKAKLRKLTDKLSNDSRLAEVNAAKAGDAEDTVPQLEKKTEKLNNELTAREEELEALKEGIKDEVEKYQKALQSVQKVRAELAPWERQMAEVQSRKDIATAEQNLLLKQQEEAEERLKAAKDGAASAIESAKAKQDEIAKMTADARSHKEEAVAQRAKAEAANADIARLEGGWREARSRLEQRKADSNAQSSQSAIVDALMQAKRSGAIQGIHGRLGDLGAIDKQYDIAISTACGGLDNIVVEDSTAAMRCVELIRQRQLGVVTCLMLDKQRHFSKAASERASPPEGVKRLFDLVKVRDEALRVAFYSALGNTLVAKDLDQASRIAYGKDKRWSRVVTLKGDMINETGTMSGGGGKPRQGRMCVGNSAPRTLDTKEAAEGLKRSETEYDRAKQALEDARLIAAAAESAAVAAEKMVQELEVAIPKAQMEVKAQQERAEDLKQRLKELLDATKVTAEDAQRLKSLASDIKATEKELQPLQKSASGLQAKAEKLQLQIEEAGGEPLKKLKKLVSSLQEEISETEEAAAKTKVDGQAAKKQAVKLEKACEKTSQEKAKAEAELAKLQTSFQELEEAAAQVAVAHGKVAAILEEKSAQLAIIKEEYDTKRNEVNVIRNVEVELESKLADLKVKLDLETKARDSNLRLLEQKRQKLAEMLGKEEAPPLPSDETLAQHNLGDVEFKVTVLEEDLTRMSPEMGAIEAYREKEADYIAKVKLLEDATTDRDGVRKGHEEMKKRRLDEFMAGFGVISMKLKEMYQMITLGGDAELELVDSLDPFSEGIVFSVRPPKKSWKNIANLSGGEKTLSSLSLVFALHHYKPTPLYVMDEIDAALEMILRSRFPDADFKNVSIVAHYIKERTKNAQFVIISLRNNMFELADRLVGIYKTDNATKSVAINPGQFTIGNAAPVSSNFQIALA